MAFHLTDSATARARAALTGLFETPVRATLDGATLYAAIEYTAGGAAVFHLPVVHLDGLARGKIGVCGAQGAAWAAHMATVEDARRIDRAELRALFAARGALRAVRNAGQWRMGEPY